MPLSAWFVLNHEIDPFLQTASSETGLFVLINALKGNYKENTSSSHVN